MKAGAAALVAAVCFDICVLVLLFFDLLDGTDKELHRSRALTLRVVEHSHYSVHILTLLLQRVNEEQLEKLMSYDWRALQQIDVQTLLAHKHLVCVARLLDQQDAAMVQAAKAAEQQPRNVHI